MSYTIQNDWQRKDVLDSGAAGKVISGAHFYNEFVAVQNEFTLKAAKGGDVNQSFNVATEIATDNTSKAASTEYVTRAITDASEGFAKYPVGSIFTTTIDYATSTDVVDEIGGTTWTPFGEGKVLVGVDPADTTDEDFDTVEKTGGAKKHPLTEDEMPEHQHFVADNGSVTESGGITSTNSVSESATQSGSTYQSYTMRPGAGIAEVGLSSVTGGDSAHNNLQPYITVYMWKRTA